MKKKVLGLLGIVALAGLGIGAYFLLKDDKESDIPSLDEEDEDNGFFDDSIAEDFDKETIDFEDNVEKVFDNSVEEVQDNNDTVIVGEPSDYENDSFMRACNVSREEAIKVILANSSDYTEEELKKMIGSDLAYIYSLVE